MWIIPSNHPLYSQFAPDLVASKKELSMQPALPFESQLMWKSRLLSLRIWSAKWNRVYWIPHLFGRMLKPSSHLHTTFVERFTALLPDIPASHLVKPVSAKDQMIPDTFGRMYLESLMQYDLFGASSKMSGDTLNWDTTRFTRIFAALVTQLSAEYTRRRKLAQHMRGNDSSSLQWPTATAWQSGEEVDTFEARRKRLKAKWGNKTGNGAGETLNIAVQKWATPLSREVRNGFQTRADREKNGQQIGLSTQVIEESKKWSTPTVVMSSMFPDKEYLERNTEGLATQVEKWKTPLSNTHKGTGPKGSKSQQTQLKNHYLSAQVENTDGQPLQEGSNIRGKRPVLSPAWTAQLMGTTLERIFFEWSEMPLYTRQQQKHILTYSQNSDE